MLGFQIIYRMANGHCRTEPWFFPYEYDAICNANKTAREDSEAMEATIVLNVPRANGTVSRIEMMGKIFRNADGTAHDSDWYRVQSC